MHTYLASGTYTISLEACNSLGCDVVEWADYVEVVLDCYSQNIPAHGNEIVTVCEGTIYDSGGPTENYLEGNFGSLTIAPPGATSISITFNEFNYEEHSDFLYVYDGDQNTGTLLGAFTGTSLQGQTLTSSTGVLTIQEYTDHFLNLSGFVATFSCVSNPKPPEPEFSIVSASVCANEPVFFVDESLDFPSSWFWEFGDGGTSNEQNPFHIYNASGTYTVSLTVCNTFGCNTLLQDITIDIDPDCLIENMPNNAQQLIFGCFGTLYDSGGADGNYLNNNNASTTIYSTAGPITLEFIEFDYETFDALVIIDGASLTDPIIGYFNGNELPESITSTGNAITIVEITDFSVAESGFQINYSCDGISRPLQGIVIINDEICDGKRSFSADSEGTLDTWYWDFGDGQTSTEANPEHEFSQHGAYEISLVACQDNVCDTMQTMIYSNKLVPEIGAPDTVALGQEIQLHGLTEAATHWSWDFGNGQTSEENAPFTTYEAAGWHDINVHLINMDVHETCDATHVHPVFVDENLTSVAKINSVTFNVYPNPTTGIVNVRGLEDLTGDYQIRIISSIGQVVKVQPLDATISIAAFPAGMYILEVVNEKEVMGRSRIIKE
jgi:PKD repeat protein